VTKFWKETKKTTDRCL